MSVAADICESDFRSVQFADKN